MTISLAQLQEIFRSAFNEDIELQPDSSKDTLDAWDSINHLQLIVELEDRLSISFTKEEIEQLDSVPKLTAILAAK
ncbi:acyl carrier protein [Nostoc ellipsosporum NOK]|nr:acyl carrier protein [Nostoc ellipsosporum NOK]